MTPQLKPVLIIIGLVIIAAVFSFFAPNKSTSGIEGKTTSQWSLYTNDALGFSMHIPKTMLSIDRCASEQNLYVPVKVIENAEQGEVYIVPEYYYFEKFQDSAECEKVVNTLEHIKQDDDSLTRSIEPWLGIAIQVRPAKNNAEVEKLMQDKFGSDCKIGKKLPASEDDYSSEAANHVLVQSAGMESNCPMNFQYQVLYSSEIQKAMAVNLGQECKFIASDDFSICYDDLIMKSFQWK